MPLTIYNITKPETPTINASKNNGGTTDYYIIPKDAVTLNDLIEHKHMEFWQGDAFKTLYALQERATRDTNASEARELNKIIYYCNRRLAKISLLQPSF